MFTPLPYCVYVLFCEKDKLLYTGFTTDLERRMQQHHNGESTNTSKRGPLQLIFCEYYLFKADAEKRERYFKNTPGKKALKLMLAATLSKLGYAAMPMGKMYVVEDCL